MRNKFQPPYFSIPPISKKSFPFFFLNVKVVTFKFQYAVHNVAFAFLFECIFPSRLPSPRASTSLHICQVSNVTSPFISLSYLKDSLRMWYLFLERWETKSSST